MYKLISFVIFSTFIASACQPRPVNYNPDYYQPAVRDQGPDVALPPTIQPYKVQ